VRDQSGPRRRSIISLDLTVGVDAVERRLGQPRQVVPFLDTGIDRAEKLSHLRPTDLAAITLLDGLQCVVKTDEHR
jgi:hypothetical protein